MQWKRINYPTYRGGSTSGTDDSAVPISAASMRPTGSGGQTAAATYSRNILAAAVTSADVNVTVDRSQKLMTSKLALGSTNESTSLNSWGDPTAIANGHALLDGATTFQNQNIYGWGATNPEPSPGVFDWRSLDARIARIRSRANSIPVITLAGAPDWMTVQGTNTSNYKLGFAPTADHYNDFAELARRTALRYSAPGSTKPVLYYQVWQEMKGFWSRSMNNMDYVAYTTMYNKVYDALKSVNPTIQVGGPHVVPDGTGSQSFELPPQWYIASPLTSRTKTLLEYWLANKHGADFICIDRGIVAYQDPNVYSLDQKFELVHWFGDGVRQIQQLSGYRGEPIWYAEGFAFASNARQDVQRAAEAAAIRSDLLAGAAVLLKWQNEATYTIPRPEGPETVTGLFTSTLHSGGGQPYPVYTAYKLFHDYFPPGTAVYRATSSSPGVQALASASQTLLINVTAATLTVSVNGTTVPLAPYDVRVVNARRG